jgi:hypothetical protein
MRLAPRAPDAGTVLSTRYTLRSASIRALDGVLRPWSLLTARERLLPSFLVVGAQKAGTTSLNAYLGGHPQVVLPRRKELHFFDQRYHLGALYYRSHFPMRAQMERRGARVTGEATPYYLFHPDVPARVAETCPGVKLIVLLRRPVDRAFSHYQHQVRRGRERRTFEEAVAEELRRCASGAPEENGYREQHFSYLRRGLYKQQLDRWRAWFGRDAFLLLQSEQMFADPVGTLEKVTDFLGLTPVAIGSLQSRNAGGYRDEPAQRIRAELEAFFREPNEELQRAWELDWTW